MSIINICNSALLEIGARVQINSLDDNSPAANACSLLYHEKVRMLLRGACWDFARRQVPLTLYKAAVINGNVSANPPPQPWQYEYLYPPDCLKARFLIPTYPTSPAGTPLTTGQTWSVLTPTTITSIPFVIATDLDSERLPVKVILTNLPLAQLVYTQDLSDAPDMWDALFTTGAIAVLAAYLINPLARNAGQLNQQIAVAKGVLDAARAANGNESISNADHVPDFLAIRFSGSAALGAWGNGQNGPYYSGYDACAFPDGLTY